MKFITQIIVIAIVAMLAQLILPWWIVAVVAFVVSFFYNNHAMAAFGAGFLAVAALWLVYAAILDNASQSILSSKMAQLFPLPNNPVMMLLMAVIVGGLVGGMGAITGNRLRKIF